MWTFVNFFFGGSIGRRSFDHEVSFSADMTETGVKAGARSRAIASIDRLVGAFVDMGTAKFEGTSRRRRTIDDGQVALIKAAADYGVAKLGSSPEYAYALLQTHFEKMVKGQASLEAAVEEAKEDLIQGPQDYADTDKPISEEFYDRFETYASHATSDELRQRWGRVQASEIRTPGTFSNKVLRVVDELDAETALLFEEVCKSRVGSGLYKPGMRTLNFVERSRLTAAGLIVEHGALGQKISFLKIRFDNGVDYIIAGNVIMLAVPFEEFSRQEILDAKELFHIQNDYIGVPAYVLTDEGMALSSILPDNSKAAIDSYAEMIAAKVSSRKILLMTHVGGQITQCGFSIPA